ncbi:MULTISPECIES: RNA polymerase sigma factor [Sorangium]|uniref:RNA polymerase sigma factor n=1 Tax=Sorangium TaxID=39643 RepID=UPI003D9C10B3
MIRGRRSTVPSLTAVAPSTHRGSVQALPLSATDDETLARAAAQGHPGAAPIVWQRFAPIVRRILKRTLGPGDEVDDHVQDTFLRFFRVAKDLRDPSMLSSFIVGIAVRVARGELRRRRLRRWLTLSSSGELPEVGGAQQDPQGRAALARLYLLLDQVDDRSRTLFVLRFIEGLELTEIAAALGCSLATTKRHLARASHRILTAAQRDPALSAYLAKAPQALELPGVDDE